METIERGVELNAPPDDAIRVDGRFFGLCHQRDDNSVHWRVVVGAGRDDVFGAGRDVLRFVFVNVAASDGERLATSKRTTCPIVADNLVRPFAGQLDVYSHVYLRAFEYTTNEAESVIVDCRMRVAVAARQVWMPDVQAPIFRQDDLNKA